MDEIERVIALVESFEQSEVALLEMKFSFHSLELCQAFFDKVREGAADLVNPKQSKTAFICGVREEVKLDADTMRSLCHRYREVAYQYQGEPLKWAVRVRGEM